MGSRGRTTDLGSGALNHDPTPLSDAEIDALEARLMGDGPIEMHVDTLDEIIWLIESWRGKRARRTGSARPRICIKGR